MRKIVAGLALLSLVLIPLLVQADSVDNDLTVNAASFLGGSGDDALSAVEIAPDRHVVIAGNIAGANFGQTPVEIQGGGDGILVRLDSTGQTVQSVTRFPNAVTDMAVDYTTGNITVMGDFGVITLDATASTEVWRATPGTAGTMRVAVAQDGTVAALVNREVTVYQASDGTELGSFTVEFGNGTLDDIAINSADSLVYVVGFRQVTGILQLPLVRAYPYDGSSVTWTAYEFTASEAQNDNSTADTEAKRITIGRDGELYLSGQTDGGNNVFRRDPQNIDQNGNNINIGIFSNTSGASGARNFGYVARLDPATGAHDRGQYIVNRLSDGGANSFGVNAIAADEEGLLYLGGGAFASVSCRSGTENDPQRCPSGNVLKINGTTVGPYNSNEGAVIS